MKTVFKRISIVLGIFVLWLGYWVTDNFIYPIKAVNPNYSDVESAFAKLQFPADWQEISSSENRGLHGRDCDPLNNSGCFHKSKKFKIPETANIESAKAFMVRSGCTTFATTDFTANGEEKNSTSLSCTLVDEGNIKLRATLKGLESSLNVTASTY